MSQRIVDRLKQRFGDAVLESHAQLGDDTAVVDPARWREIAAFLRDDAECKMDHFIDLTAVDWLHRRTPRFEVVLHLRSSEKLHRIRLKARVDVSEGQQTATIDSLADVYKGANWFERECYDMFGIEFGGHPDLRRILMYDQFEGHPLRKDYPAARAQPLIAYREEALDKLPPFGASEGLPFGRQTHDHGPAARDLLAELENGADGQEDA